MNHRRAGILVVVCICLAGRSGVGAQSPKPGAKPSAKPKATVCDTLLTKDEVVGIVGADFAGPAFREPRPGFTSCEWQASEANFGFTFSSLRLLKVERQTAEESFDIDLQAVEDDQRKREVVPDVGLKAALVSLGDDAFLVAVQRGDGVARMTFYKIAKDKVIALARALGAP